VAGINTVGQAVDFVTGRVAALNRQEALVGGSSVARPGW